MKEQSKWLKRHTANFEREARREARKKRQVAEAAAKDAKALEARRDLLLSGERYERLAPKEETPDKPELAPDVPGKPKRVTGANAKWPREKWAKGDLSLKRYYRGKIYATNADGTSAPLHGAMSHNPRGRRPGKPNKLVYQVAVGRTGIETIMPSKTWLGRPVAFGWALVDGKAPPWVLAADARLDEMVKADRHLVEACLMKEEEDGTSHGAALGTGVADRPSWETA